MYLFRIDTGRSRSVELPVVDVGAPGYDSTRASPAPTLFLQRRHPCLFIYLNLLRWIEPIIRKDFLEIAVVKFMGK